MNAPRRPSSAVMDWSGGYGWVGGVPLKATLKDFLMKITHSFWPSKSININSARSKGLRVYFLLLFIADLQWGQNLWRVVFWFHERNIRHWESGTIYRYFESILNWLILYFFSDLLDPAASFGLYNSIAQQHPKDHRWEKWNPIFCSSEYELPKKFHRIRLV